MGNMHRKKPDSTNPRSIENTQSPADVQSSNMQTSNAQPSNAQASNAQASNAQPSNAQVSNAQPSNSQSSRIIRFSKQSSDEYSNDIQISSNLPTFRRQRSPQISREKHSYPKNSTKFSTNAIFYSDSEGSTDSKISRHSQFSRVSRFSRDSQSSNNSDTNSRHSRDSQSQSSNYSATNSQFSTNTQLTNYTTTSAQKKLALNKMNLEDPKEFAGFSQSVTGSYLFDLMTHNYTEADQNEIYHLSNTLGNVSKHPSHYFDTSEDSIDCSREFLSKFFNDKKIYDYITDRQRQKNIIQNRGKGVSKTIPSVVSFVTVTVNDEKYCLISFSTTRGSSVLLRHVYDFVKHQLPVSKNGYKFVVCDGSVNDIHELMVSINDAAGWDMSDKAKACAERLYFLKLLELFNNNKTIVNGVVNLFLFPCQKGCIYNGNNEFGLSVSEVSKFHFDISEKFYTNLVTCCKECEKNKSAVLLALSTAQKQYSERMSLKLSHSEQEGALAFKIEGRFGVHLLKQAARKNSHKFIKEIVSEAHHFYVEKNDLKGYADFLFHIDHSGHLDYGVEANMDVIAKLALQTLGPDSQMPFYKHVMPNGMPLLHYFAQKNSTKVIHELFYRINKLSTSEAIEYYMHVDNEGRNVLQALLDSNLPHAHDTIDLIVSLASIHGVAIVYELLTNKNHNQQSFIESVLNREKTDLACQVMGYLDRSTAETIFQNITSGSSNEMPTGQVSLPGNTMETSQLPGLSLPDKMEISQLPESSLPVDEMETSELQQLGLSGNEMGSSHLDFLVNEMAAPQLVSTSFLITETGSPKLPLLSLSEKAMAIPQLSAEKLQVEEEVKENEVEVKANAEEVKADGEDVKAIVDEVEVKAYEVEVTQNESQAKANEEKSKANEEKVKKHLELVTKTKASLLTDQIVGDHLRWLNTIIENHTANILADNFQQAEFESDINDWQQGQISGIKTKLARGENAEFDWFDIDDFDYLLAEEMTKPSDIKASGDYILPVMILKQFDAYGTESLSNQLLSIIEENTDNTYLNLIIPLISDCHWRVAQVEIVYGEITSATLYDSKYYDVGKSEVFQTFSNIIQFLPHDNRVVASPVCYGAQIDGHRCGDYTAQMALKLKYGEQVEIEQPLSNDLNAIRLADQDDNIRHYVIDAISCKLACELARVPADVSENVRANVSETVTQAPSELASHTEPLNESENMLESLCELTNQAEQVANASAMQLADDTEQLDDARAMQLAEDTANITETMTEIADADLAGDDDEYDFQPIKRKPSLKRKPDESLQPNKKPLVDDGEDEQQNILERIKVSSPSNHFTNQIDELLYETDKMYSNYHSKRNNHARKQILDNYTKIKDLILSNDGDYISTPTLVNLAKCLIRVARIEGEPCIDAQASSPPSNQLEMQKVITSHLIAKTCISLALEKIKTAQPHTFHEDELNRLQEKAQNLQVRLDRKLAHTYWDFASDNLMNTFWGGQVQGTEEQILKNIHTCFEYFENYYKLEGGLKREVNLINHCVNFLNDLNGAADDLEEAGYYRIAFEIYQRSSSARVLNKDVIVKLKLSAIHCLVEIMRAANNSVENTESANQVLNFIHTRCQTRKQIPQDKDRRIVAHYLEEAYKVLNDKDASKKVNAYLNGQLRNENSANNLTEVSSGNDSSATKSTKKRKASLPQSEKIKTAKVQMPAKVLSAKVLPAKIQTPIQTSTTLAKPVTPVDNKVSIAKFSLLAKSESAEKVTASKQTDKREKATEDKQAAKGEKSNAGKQPPKEIKRVAKK